MTNILKESSIVFNWTLKDTGRTGISIAWTTNIFPERYLRTAHVQSENLYNHVRKNQGNWYGVDFERYE